MLPPWGVAGTDMVLAASVCVTAAGVGVAGIVPVIVWVADPPDTTHPLPVGVIVVDTVYVLPTDPVIAIGFTTEPLTVVDWV